MESFIHFWHVLSSIPEPFFFASSRAAVGHSACARPCCCFALRFTLANDGRGTPADAMRHRHRLQWEFGTICIKHAFFCYAYTSYFTICLPDHLPSKMLNSLTCNTSLNTCLATYCEHILYSHSLLLALLHKKNILYTNNVADWQAQKMSKLNQTMPKLNSWYRGLANQHFIHQRVFASTHSSAVVLGVAEQGRCLFAFGVAEFCYRCSMLCLH